MRAETSSSAMLCSARLRPLTTHKLQIWMPRATERDKTQAIFVLLIRTKKFGIGFACR